GTLAVTVTNPAPGGGTSPAATVTVAGAGGLTITSISPNTFTVQSPDTGISVTGTGFTINSVVQWNGVALVPPPSNTAPTDFLAPVPAAALAPGGTAFVTVTTAGANPPLSNSIT